MDLGKNGIDKIKDLKAAKNWIKKGYRFEPNANVDPGLDDFISQLNDNGVKVFGKNMNIIKGNGVVGEMDVITKKLLIQYKNGAPLPKKIITQMNESSIPFTNREVVAFINGSDKAALRTMRKLRGLEKGGRINFRFTNDINELLKWLKK